MIADDKKKKKRKRNWKKRREIKCIEENQETKRKQEIALE